MIIAMTYKYINVSGAKPNPPTMTKLKEENGGSPSGGASAQLTNMDLVSR